MSGPKGGCYRVESAQQREARLLRDAKARYARARSIWQAAQSRVAATSSMINRNFDLQAPAAPAADAGSAEFEHAASALEVAARAAVDAASSAREQFASATFADQIARIAAAAAAERSVVTEPASPVQRGSVAIDDTLAESSVDRIRVRARVERRLTELADLEHNTDRVKILITDIANARTETRIELLISELDLILSAGRAVREHEVQVAQVRADLEEMAARITDVTGAQADALRGRISEAVTAETTSVPAGLQTAVDAVIADADADTDRRHVIAAMRGALEELGYTLGTEFDTQLEGSRGTAVIAGPTAGYGVKVRLEEDVNRFSAQAVKSDAALTSRKEDTEAERRFCGDFAALTALLRDDGVTLDVDIHLEPGATSVQVVPAEQVTPTGVSGAARRHRPTERERSQP
ncbi:hypothetical protein C6A86_023645 [Mycobacterium sp. ITM-2016-00316]|uniref:hypothetical protein n=1 Tax=Mycobacterium sp. ITM-2016-00316 TaxID=2099695 RepID=UPI000D4D43AA|nr:hypothetical protein [Mycobacterium sp. ITM-2016-00316]WNG81154.1 hypothetical protein C6A86_023645 [Mycobacterium sp. ITM-2016-00316]